MEAPAANVVVRKADKLVKAAKRARVEADVSGGSDSDLELSDFSGKVRGMLESWEEEECYMTRAADLAMYAPQCAFRAFEEAVEKYPHCQRARYELAICHYQGTGTATNHDKALVVLQELNSMPCPHKIVNDGDPDKCFHADSMWREARILMDIGGKDNNALAAACLAVTYDLYRQADKIQAAGGKNSTTVSKEAEFFYLWAKANGDGLLPGGVNMRAAKQAIETACSMEPWNGPYKWYHGVLAARVERAAERREARLKSA